jgi:hypothetical protein
VTYKDGWSAWGARVVYGFLFFVIIGVLLFNIVTGIIIDKFSALRETADQRAKFFKSTNLISDLTRADYDKVSDASSISSLCGQLIRFCTWLKAQS